MILLLAYLGGVLTILSPCVLPVIPFVFSRADRPFRQAGLPMLVGMGLSFALFAALSVAGGRWVIQANQAGRALALAVLALLGLTLLWPRLAERMAAPLVRLGSHLQMRADAAGAGIGTSLALGASLGLLWAPCAGPILGLLLAGASFNASAGASSTQTFALLLVFALGAATSLALALFAGARVLKLLKRGLGAEEWIRRGLGALVLLAVLAIALGWDARLLARLSFVNTNRLEQSLLERALPAARPRAENQAAPDFTAATEWLNSPPLQIDALRGKVVLVDFWTYSCINCLRTLPYLKAWHEKYRAHGLVIVGIHAPEFAFEKIPENVQRAVRELAIPYPVALDNERAVWAAYRNRYWPGHHFIDARGVVRHVHYGEGEYAESERWLRELLAEIPGTRLPPPTDDASLAAAQVTGVEAPPAIQDAESSETYLGYDRQEGFTSVPSLRRDEPTLYRVARELRLDEWALQGPWRIGLEKSTLVEKPGSVVFRFQARDVHLVIGNAHGTPVRFRVTIDGQVPGADHGTDIDAQGLGTVRSQRLYQLLRRRSSEGEHTVRIEFLDAGAEVYAFTFG